MAKLSALLYRELRLCRNRTILGIVFVLFHTLVWWCVLLSLPHNTFDGVETTEITKKILDGSALIIPFISIFIINLNDNFKRDLSSGWSRYSYALPITPLDRVMTIAMRIALFTVIAMIFSTLNVFGMCMALGAKFTFRYIAMQVLIFDCFLLMTIPFEYFILSARTTEQFKSRSDKGGLTSVFMALVIGFVVFTQKEKFTEGEFNISKLMDKILQPQMFIWLVLIMLVLLGVYFVMMYYLLGPAETQADKKVKIVADEVSNNFAKHHYITGFLYKELRQNRANILIILFMPLFLTVLSVLMIAFSVKVNSTAVTLRQFAEMTTTGGLRIGIIIGGGFIVSGLLLNLFTGDDTKLWGHFVLATPYGTKRFVKYKYITMSALTVLYILVWFVVGFILSGVRYLAIGEYAESLFKVHIFILFTLLFMSAIDIPLTLRYGMKKGNIIKTVVMMAVLLLLTMAFTMISQDLQGKIIEKIIEIFSGQTSGLEFFVNKVFPFISLGLFILSYNISCKAFVSKIHSIEK